METLIEEAHHPGDGLAEGFTSQDYHILGPAGNIVLPRQWEDLVNPGWTVTLQSITTSTDRRAQVRSDQRGLQHEASPTKDVRPLEDPKIRLNNREAEQDVRNDHGNSEDNIRDTTGSSTPRAPTPPPAIGDSKNTLKTQTVACEDNSEYDTAGTSTYDDSGDSTGNDGDPLTDDLMGMIARSRLWGEDIKTQMKEAVAREAAIAQIRLRRRHAKIMFDESVSEYRNHGWYDPDIPRTSAVMDEADSTFSDAQVPNLRASFIQEQPKLGKSRVPAQLTVSPRSESSGDYQTPTTRLLPTTKSRSAHDPWNDAIDRKEYQMPGRERRDVQIPYSRMHGPDTTAQFQPTRPPTPIHDPTPPNTTTTGAGIPLEQKIDFLSSLLARQESERRAKDAEMKHAANEARVRQLEAQLLSQEPRPQPYPHQPSLSQRGFEAGFVNPLITPPITPLTAQSSAEVPLASSTSATKSSSSQTSSRRGLRRRLLGSS